MLEQLDKVQGVDSSMANHSGSLVRIRIDDVANPDEVAAELEQILQEQKRKPKQLSGEDLARAIRDEQWRSKETVGQLSEIEFRTIFTRQVEEFAASPGLNDETKTKLINMSSQVLAEMPEPTQDTNWAEYCKDLATRMGEKAKDLLNAEQLEALAGRLKFKIVIVGK